MTSHRTTPEAPEQLPSAGHTVSSQPLRSRTGPLWLATAILAPLLLLGSCGGERSGPAPSVAPKTAAYQLRDVASEVGLDFSFDHAGKSPLNILETGGLGGGFVDYDADGDLDILIASPQGCKVYRQNADRFENVPDAAGLPRSGHWQGLASGDFDNDGRADVLLTGFHDLRLFRNTDQGFRDVTQAAGLTDRTHWNTSAAFTDVDNDGRLDLFICRYVQFGPSSRQLCEDKGLMTACPPGIYPPEKSVMYRNLGGGRFAPFAAKTLAQSNGRSWSVLPFDYNNDGWTDLYVANDTEPADFWRNKGGRDFENVGYETGTALSTYGRAYGGMGLDAPDVDGDGHLDLFLASFTDEPKSLFRNLGTGTSFQDVGDTWGLGVLRPYVSWGCAWEDFDNDGHLDLACVSGHIIDNYGKLEATSKYAQPSHFFHNTGGNRLEQLPPEAVPSLAEPIVGRTLVPADYDSDGQVDLLVLDLEGKARLLHNETPSRGNHWIGIRLIGARANRQGVGARITVTAGQKSWVSEVRTSGSVFSARDPRLRFGLGETSRVDEVRIRWPGGRESVLHPATSDKYVVVRQ